MNTVEFTRCARELMHLARTLGLDAPAFKTPPRRGARSIQGTGADAMVAVRLFGRTHAQVTDDMIQGIARANRIRHDDPSLAPLYAAMATDRMEGPPDA